MFEADAIPPKEIFRLPDGDPEEAEHAAETVECSVSSRSVSMVCGFVSRVVRVQSRCSWSVPCILPTIGDPGWIRDEWCRLLSDGAFQLESDELIVSSKSVSTLSVGAGSRVPGAGGGLVVGGGGPLGNGGSKYSSRLGCVTSSSSVPRAASMDSVSLFPEACCCAGAD